MVYLTKYIFCIMFVSEYSLTFVVEEMKNVLSKRQNEIIKISLELIAQKGIQGLTIKNLAVEIGVVESAIYRHFKNKFEILDTILETIRENSIADNFDKNINTILQLEEGWKNHFKIFASFPALVSVIFSEDLFQNETSLLNKTKEIMQKSINDLTSIIKYGQKKEEIRSDIKAEHLALMLIGSIRMYVKQWKMSDYSYDLSKRGKVLIGSLKQILKPIDK